MVFFFTNVIKLWFLYDCIKIRWLQFILTVTKCRCMESFYFPTIIVLSVYEAGSSAFADVILKLFVAAAGKVFWNAVLYQWTFPQDQTEWYMYRVSGYFLPPRSQHYLLQFVREICNVIARFITLYYTDITDFLRLYSIYIDNNNIIDIGFQQIFLICVYI